MGTIYLLDLAHNLRAAGLDVIEMDGWQYRSRSSGGYDALPLCVMWHHTASGPSSDGWNDANYIATGHPDSPISNLYINRSGTVWICAGGASNTNGKGQSIAFSRGTVPKDSMNTRALGVEMGNNGIGERWPRAQIDAMFTVSNICNEWFGNQPDDLSTHQYYAPDRKIDPATCNVEGPWVPISCTSSGSWDRTSVQVEALNRAAYRPEPIPPNGDDDMAYACEGLWKFRDVNAIFAVYAGGYKTWIPDNAALVAKQNLCKLHGVNGNVQTQTDEGMWKAFGPVLDPVPGGFDKWGLKS